MTTETELELRIEGPVVIIQTDADPGDIGEPRTVWDDDAKATVVFVPSFDLWPEDEYAEATNAAMNFGDGFAEGRAPVIAWVERQMNTPWSPGFSEDFRRGYDTAVEEVDAIVSGSSAYAHRRRARG